LLYFGLEFDPSLGLNVKFDFISMASFIQRTTAVTPQPDNMRTIQKNDEGKDGYEGSGQRQSG
jgi:hypothetical protein